jgi:hypothetical protein
MKTVGRDLARLDALIAQAQARARVYRGDDCASRHRAQRDPPQLPPHPSPPPPPLPSFPRESLAAATARFILAASRRARGESPPEPDSGEDGDRDKPPKEPPDPGSLILDAVRRRQEGK